MCQAFLVDVPVSGDTLAARILDAMTEPVECDSILVVPGVGIGEAASGCDGAPAKTYAIGLI